MKTTLARLAKLEAAAPAGAGNWVVGLSGNIIWDPWDPDRAVDDGALERVMARLEQTAERLRSQPDWPEPTPAQRAEATARLEEMIQRMRAERAAVRDFTAKVERERARPANCS
jgi:hypothetical protein